MIKSSKTSIVCKRYNFQETESEDKDMRLVGKLASLIKITSDIANELKSHQICKFLNILNFSVRKTKSNIQLKELAQDILILQNKQKTAQDSLLTLLNDMDMELDEDDFSYDTLDPEFKQFDYLMEGLAQVIDNTEKEKKDKEIEEKLLKSIAGVMKKKVEEMEEESLKNIVRRLSIGLVIANNNIAENNIVVDPNLLNFEIEVDVGRIPKSILVEHETTYLTFSKKNEFLIVKGSFGYQIFKGKKGFFNLEEMLCNIKNYIYIYFLGDYTDVIWMNNFFYVYCNDSKTIKIQKVEREKPELLHAIKEDSDSDEEDELNSTLYSALKDKALVVRTNTSLLQFIGLDVETGKKSQVFNQRKFEKIGDLKFFGNLKDHFALVSQEGSISYLKIFKISGMDFNTKEVGSCQIPHKSTPETKYSLAISPKFNIIAISIFEPNDMEEITNKINIGIYEFKNSKINFIDSYQNEVEGGVGEFRSLGFLNNYHNLNFLAALEFKENSRIFTFYYDSETRVVAEKENMRGLSGVGKVAGFEKIGNNIFRGADTDAKVFEICYKMSEE